MISVIICSRREKLDPDLAENIRQTVGVPYEIIRIDNSHGQYNIFEAYNLGVGRAKGEFLCFMHEDIVFHSNDWGRAVEQYLSKPQVGAIGVAGGNVVLDRFDWRFYGDFYHTYMMQGAFTVTEQPEYTILAYPPPKRRPLFQVAVIDGVWMCMRRNLFDTVRFDDVTFHDFHLYDSDICMQINAMGLGVFVTNDVLLEHRSEGTFSRGFTDALQVFFDKWRNNLPMIRGAMVSDAQIQHILIHTATYFEERLRHDAIVIELRRLFAQKRLGKAVRPYTEEERSVMDRSFYQHIKCCIKNHRIPASEVWATVRRYCRSEFARHPWKVRLKFLWYRVLGF
jgi:GT2 family glycosyltransferase